MTLSSTSSSDASAAAPGLPWAFVGAVVIVLLIEVGLRLVAIESIASHRRVDPDGERRTRFQMIAHGGIDAEIDLVGSSRTGEALHMGMVADAATSATGRTIRCTRLVSAASLPIDVEAIVSDLATSAHPPRWIIYGMSPIQLLQTRDDYNTRAYELWTLSDWFQFHQWLPRPWSDALDTVIYNELSSRCRLLAIRGTFFERMRDAYESRRMPSIVYDPETYNQRHRPDDSLLDPAMKILHRRGYTPWELKKVELHIGEPQLLFVAETIRICQEHDIDLVIAELPLSSFATPYYPQEYLEQFRAQLRAWDAERNVETFMLEDADLVFGDGEFRDPSHLNLPGARRYTQALIDTVLRPLWAEAATRE